MTSFPREKFSWIWNCYIIFLIVLIPYSLSAQPGTTASTGGAADAERAGSTLEPGDIGMVEKTDIYYDSEGLSDPFVSLLTGLNVADESDPKPPGIKGMTIGELALFGLGKWEQEDVAFVTGSDGKAYTLHVGDLVFDGRVKAIYSDKIIFEKWVYDPLNRPKPPKSIEIKLHPTVEEVTR